MNTSPAVGRRTSPFASVDLGLLLVAVVWGSSYLAAKDVTAVLSVPVLLALRCTLMIAGLGVLCACRRPARDAWGRGAGNLRVGALLGCTLASVLALETFGVARTSATNAGLIISLSVVLTPVLDNVWSRCWLPAPFFVAVTVVVVGVALLVSGSGFRAPSWGDVLMLAAAVTRAVHVTLIGRLTRGGGFDTLVLTTVQSAVAAVVLTVVAVPDLGSVVSLTTATWLRVGYLALVCGLFAFVVQMWAVRRTSPGRASLMMGTEPVWAVVIGVALGGERLGILGTVGAALIVAGTYRGQLLEARHRAAVALPAFPGPVVADQADNQPLARGSERRAMQTDEALST